MRKPALRRWVDLICSWRLLLLVCVVNVAHAATPYTACDTPLTRPLQPLSSGWSRDLQQTRDTDAEQAGITADTLPRLQLKWAFAFKGAEQPRSLPAITQTAIFVGSQEGALWAMDRKTGCVYWRHEARKKIRSAVSVVDTAEHSWVFFGDDDGYVYALDAVTGALQWEAVVDAHPAAVITGSPVFHDGFLYVPASSMEVTSAMNPFYDCCVFRGSVSKFNAATGERVWQYYTIPDHPREQQRNWLGVTQFSPSGAAVWSSPTIDVQRNRLYVGCGQNYSGPADSNSDAIHAVDLTTGQRVWRKQFLAMDAWNAACQLGPLGFNCPQDNGPDYDFGAPPILVNRVDGTPVLVAGQKSGMVYAMNPDTGDVLWSQSVGRGGMLGGVHWGMAADSQAVYAPISDYDIAVVTPPPGEPKPSLAKLDLLTGRIVWQVPAVFDCRDETGSQIKGCRSGLSAAISLIPGAVLAPGLDGVIHAYRREDGKEIWHWDTKRRMPSVNGITAEGGTLDAGGVVAVDGQLFLNAGYGGLISAGGRSGNAFIVLGQ